LRLGDDPGTGWDLAKVLAALTPCCPVIIHTSSGERATWMRGRVRPVRLAVSPRHAARRRLDRERLAAAVAASENVTLR